MICTKYQNFRGAKVIIPMESGFLFYYIYFLCNNIQHFYAFLGAYTAKHTFSMVAHSELALSAKS